MEVFAGIYAVAFVGLLKRLISSLKEEHSISLARCYVIAGIGGAFGIFAYIICARIFTF